MLVAYMLPLALVSSIAGVFVDRWHVKQVMIWSDLIRGVLVLLLLWVTKVTNLTQLCAIFTVLALVSRFFGPAQSNGNPHPGRQRKMAANALVSRAFYTVRLLSPVVVGALVAWLTEKSCFYFDAFSFFFSAAMIGSLLFSRTPAPSKTTVKGFFSQLTSRNRFIFFNPSIFNPCSPRVCDHLDGERDVCDELPQPTVLDLRARYPRLRRVPLWRGEFGGGRRVDCRHPDGQQVPRAIEKDHCSGGAGDVLGMVRHTRRIPSVRCRVGRDRPTAGFLQSRPAAAMEAASRAD